jgi:hypothetical protein
MAKSRKNDSSKEWASLQQKKKEYAKKAAATGREIGKTIAKSPKPWAMTLAKAAKSAKKKDAYSSKPKSNAEMEVDGELYGVKEKVRSKSTPRGSKEVVKAKGTGYANPIKKYKKKTKDGVVVKEKVKYQSGKAMERKQRRADRRARRN